MFKILNKCPETSFSSRIVAIERKIDLVHCKSKKGVFLFTVLIVVLFKYVLIDEKDHVQHIKHLSNYTTAGASDSSIIIP